jgi:hypothetical protein
MFQEYIDHQQAGTFSREWNASAYPSGIYILTVQGSGFRSAQKISHLK